jgi:hypothetical protein
LEVEIHMKTQVHKGDLRSNPMTQSRNVWTVSNDEDRIAPSFDDLFEDPDVPDRPKASGVATPPPTDRDGGDDPAAWSDDFDLPDFVTPVDSTPDARPEPELAFSERHMSNVNVIGAVQPVEAGSANGEVAQNLPVDNDYAPEFVPPLDGFATGAGSAAPQVSSGRLYRSAGAEGPAAAMAIPALAGASAGAIRITPDAKPSQQIISTPDPAEPLTDPRDRSAAATYARENTAETEAPPNADESLTSSPRRALRPSVQPAGLTYNGAAVVIIAATVLVGFIDALLNHRLGWLTGIALVASSIYAAVNVRLTDAWAPAILAPLGFMAATLTAGQLTRGSSGSWFVREGYMIFRSLAVNAPWIIGATAICAAIAFWRRRQA